MAKRTVTFDDYKEPTWEQYTGEEPPANRWFTAVVKRASYDKEEDQMVFIAEISEGDFKGWGRGWYAPFDGNLKWKMHEIIRALTGKTASVSLDWENETAVANWLKKAKPFRLRTEDYNDKIKIKTVAPLLAAVPGTGTAAPAPGPAPDAEPEAAEEPLEDYTEEELNAIETVEELEQILTDEFDFADEDLPELPARAAARDKDGSKYRALLIETILAEQEGDPESDADGDTDGDVDAAEGDFDDGFADDADDNGTEADPEPDPEPAKPARRTRATKAAPAKAAPAKAAAAPATTRRRRG